MLHLTLVFLLSPCLSYVRGQETIRLYPGEIRGTTIVTRNGRNISAFLGIPYAKPPVGPLRFKNPEPIDMEDRVIQSDKDGERCPQLNDDGDVVGDEDCLFLNIYTPNPNPNPPIPYPTMVYFHGGDFVKGSGSSMDAGPEYLLDRDIVLVTVNYRLGALGFLSTGDAVSTGNFGLKDQVVALKWVKKNVLAFGGHPRNVTIFGQGAGGVCTSLHTVSQASQGLFQQYIAQSGNLFPFWASRFIQDYMKRATELGRRLKCPTDNSRVLVDCLRNADTRSLVEPNNMFQDRYGTFGSWRPTTETGTERDAFLVKDLTYLARFKPELIRDIPAILGNVADEGLVMTAYFQTNNEIYDRIARNVTEFVVHMTELFFVNPNPQREGEMVRMYYINDTEPSDKEAFSRKVTKLISDIAFVVPLDDLIKSTMHEKRKSPLYYYSFDYRGTFSRTSSAFGSNDNIGVTHGDDLIYLFPAKKLFKENPDLQLSDSDEKMIDIMVDLWTSFAETGIPVANSTSDPYFWEPYNNNTMNNLKIGNDSDPVLSTQYETHLEGIVFWRLLDNLHVYWEMMKIYS